MKIFAPAIALCFLAASAVAEQEGRLSTLCARRTADYVRQVNPRSVLLSYPAEHRAGLLRALWGELTLHPPESGQFSERAAEIVPLLLLLGEPEADVRRAVSGLVRRFCDGRDAALAAAPPTGFLRPRTGLRIPLVVDLIGDEATLEIMRRSRETWGYGDGGAQRFSFDRALRLALQAADREAVLRIIVHAAVYGQGGDLVSVLDEYQETTNLDEAYFLLGAFALQAFFQSPHHGQRGAPHLLDEAIEAWGRARRSSGGREALRRVAHWLARPTVHDHYVHLWEHWYPMHGGRAAARVFGARLTALRYCGEWTRFERVDSVRWEITTRVTDLPLREEVRATLAAVNSVRAEVRGHAIEEVRRAERALREGLQPQVTALSIVPLNVPSHLAYLVHLLDTEQVTLHGYEDATPATLAAAANAALARGDYPNAIRLFIAASRPPGS